MTVTTIPIDVGAAPGDGTGDPARTGGQSVNTSIANLDAAVEALQSAGVDKDNTTESVTKGQIVISDDHAGITKTLPAASGAINTNSYNVIWLFNLDSNSDITVDPTGTDPIYTGGASNGAGTNVTLPAGYAAMLTERTDVTGWNMAVIKVTEGIGALAGLSNVGTDTATSGNVLVADGTDWDSATPEAADLVQRSVAAFESTPYMYHESRGTRSSGTETVDCELDTSVAVTIGGNNVIIDLDVPGLSLPERGLADVKLGGKVFVTIDGSARTGLTVTTNAGSKLGTFPKGTAPTAANERAVLVWEWYDDGATDFMWAEWVNQT